MRSAVLTAFVGATLLTGAGTADAGIGLPSMSSSGSESTGSAGGVVVTGSAGIACLAVGSAMALIGDAHLGCTKLP